jgi:hypothetical protein
VSGVFRELFVEVPLALLEASVRQAQVKQEPERPKRTSLSLHEIQNICAVLCRRYGWKNVESFRYAMRRTTGFGGRMLCGHNFLYELDDCEVMAATVMLDVLDAEVQAQPRFCYCTPREVTP